MPAKAGEPDETDTARRYPADPGRFPAPRAWPGTPACPEFAFPEGRWREQGRARRRADAGGGRGTMSTDRAAIAIVGAGPRGAGLLERLAASVPELLPDVGAGTVLDVHLIDPFPAGAGRIWRH